MPTRYIPIRRDGYHQALRLKAPRGLQMTPSFHTPTRRCLSHSNVVSQRHRCTTSRTTRGDIRTPLCAIPTNREIQLLSLMQASDPHYPARGRTQRVTRNPHWATCASRLCHPATTRRKARRTISLRRSSCRRTLFHQSSMAMICMIRTVRERRPYTPPSTQL